MANDEDIFIKHTNHYLWIKQEQPYIVLLEITVVTNAKPPLLSVGAELNKVEVIGGKL